MLADYIEYGTLVLYISISLFFCYRVRRSAENSYDPTYNPLETLVSFTWILWGWFYIYHFYIKKSDG